VSAIREWIEDANFHCRVAVQRDDSFITRHRGSVVDQHSYAYAAIGSPQQSLYHQTTGFVTAKDKVLKIQSSFSGIDHLHSGHQSVDAGGDDAKSGTLAMLMRRTHKPSAKPGVFRMREGHRRRLRKVSAGSEGCAASETRQRKDDKNISGRCRVVPDRRRSGEFEHRSPERSQVVDAATIVTILVGRICTLKDIVDGERPCLLQSSCANLTPRSPGASLDFYASRSARRRIRAYSARP
jgi:hypothetical protein